MKLPSSLRKILGIGCWGLALALSGTGCADATEDGRGIGGESDGVVDAASMAGGEAATGAHEPGLGSCSFSVSHQLSSAISTVGIVDWSTDMPGAESGRIEFALADGGRGLITPDAPLKSGAARSLILGMKGDGHEYLFHIVAQTGEEVCTSGEFSITTGDVPLSVPSIERVVHKPEAVSPGFIVASVGVGRMRGAPGTGGEETATPVFVFDQDGDVVWYADAPPNTSRARMDWEAQNMYMLSLNVGGGQHELWRVSMDGLDVDRTVSGLSDAHHDFAVAPGGVTTFIEHVGMGDAIVERQPDGTTTTLIENVDGSLYQCERSCHGNSITYHPADDTYILSDRNSNLYVKFDRAGQLQWQFGGGAPLGAALPGSWSVNHGHHLLSNGNLLIFNNGSGGGASPVIEFALDERGATAKEVWRYVSDLGSATLGDVQRLPSGNTLVTYSNAGTLHEVDSLGNLVQEITLGSLGYTIHRPSLYGRPPK